MSFEDDSDIKQAYGPRMAMIEIAELKRVLDQTKKAKQAIFDAGALAETLRNRIPYVHELYILAEEKIHSVNVSMPLQRAPQLMSSSIVLIR